MAFAPPPAATRPPLTWRFGRFELREAEHRLLADGQPVALGGRAFDLLLALARRTGELLTRHELIDAVWPGRVVEENNLSVQVNALRKVLGPEWLVTVPGRGYRLAAPAAAGAVDAEAPSPAAPVPPPMPAARTHLPSTQPLLIGRSDDLAALGTLIDQHRLVTIVGTGGMGKTRLAQTLMQLRAGAYPHGVCWVDLGVLDDPAALPSAVAVALGVDSAPGDALASLARATAGLQLLLALDNAEHLLEDVSRLAQALLDAAPGLRLLVTSQAPLRLALERVFRLGPLAIPQAALPAHEAQAFAAVALFAERAAAADHRFVLTDAQVPAVIGLCTALDGVALAIELAAARAPALGVDRLQAAMSDRLRLLTGNRNRFAPQRQQTLRAAVQWSHDLLGEAERRLFRRLGVLRGGSTLELVQAVCADAPDEPVPAAPLDDWTLLDALDQLVQRSLVELRLDGEGGHARYRLLESPRALALERLAASGEEARIRARHARAVRDTWDAAEAALQAGTLGVDAWRRDLGQELDGARDALQWAHDSGEDALALDLATAMLSRLPPALRQEKQQLVQVCQSLMDRVPDVALRQRAWAAIGVVGIDRHAAAQSLALARELGDPARLYTALCEAARVVPRDPQGMEAERLLKEARALEDPRWPPVRLRSAARIDAMIASRRGDIARALDLHRHLLRLSQAAGDPSYLTQINIADLELEAGDPQAAIGTCRTLEPQLANGREDVRLTLTRLCLASALLAVDDAAAAREPLRQAWTALAATGRAVLGADYLALLAALERRHAAAAQLAGAADALVAAAGEVRQLNPSRARERCAALVRAALGEESAAALAARGAALPAEDLARLAFPPPGG